MEKIFTDFYGGECLMDFNGGEMFIDLNGGETFYMFLLRGNI